MVFTLGVIHAKLSFLLMKLRWRFGIIAGLFLAIFSLYPQFKMLYLRGSEWNGNYAYNDIDEVAYASYIKALIDGRPRRNDPYTGRDDSPADPQPESLFSIQFAGPYTIAIPARLLGIDAPWAMTISGAIAAFFTALAIFWLIGMITNDSLYAMADALIVLAGGALFAGEGAIGEVLGTGFSYPYFPGFRRYIPAMAFPAFFLLVALVWKLINARRVSVPPAVEGGTDTRTWLLISLAVLCFGYTVFTYFYVWTTAAAWLACLTILWLIFRPQWAWSTLKTLVILGAGCLLALVPYAYLLSKRAENMDEVQLLVRTRALDLYRMPELIGFAVLALLAIFVVTKLVPLREPATLFAVSLALTPAIIFNQQLITGQQLQPIHYQVFIGNYVAGLAGVVAFALVWRRIEGKYKVGWRVLIGSLALIAAAWGFVECHYTVRVLDEVNVLRDEAYLVGDKLTQLAKNDPDAHKRVVLHWSVAEGDDLPTIAPQAVLWARHQHIFAGLTWQESKERYYQQLYYWGVEPDRLAEGMKSGDDFVSMIALFGWGRHTDRLNSEYKPLSFREIDQEAARYGAYRSSFDARRVDVTKLDYLVAPSEGFNFENVDQWYQRDEGERFGKYILYRLTPKP